MGEVLVLVILVCFRTIGMGIFKILVLSIVKGLSKDWYWYWGIVNAFSKYWYWVLVLGIVKALTKYWYL